MIRVGVLGADGRMGHMVWANVLADPEMEPVAAVDPSSAGKRMPGGPAIAPGVEALEAAGAEVAVDFTRPDAVMENVEWLIEHGIHAVVGTTGIGPAELDRIRGWLEGMPGVGVVVAPNFSIGAVIAQRLSEEAARFFPAAEVIELHHDQKLDAPSGTAAATARRIASARKEAWAGPGGGEYRGGEIDGIRVHSVRLPGLVAHQEVIFGAQGQTLTIRHDAPDRSCYMPGVLLAIRQVGGRPGLTVGLEPLLDL